MKFFRWLLSNLLLIIVILGLVYTYVYWGNLAGSDTPAGKAIAYLSDEFVEVREFVDGIKQKNQARNEAGSHESKAGDQLAAQATGQSDAGSDEPASLPPVTTQAPASTSSSSSQYSLQTLEPVRQQASATGNSGESESATPESAADDNVAEADTAAAKQAAATGSGAMPAEQIAPVSGTPEAAAAEVDVTPAPVTISYSHNQQQIQQDSDGNVVASRAEQPAAVDVAPSAGNNSATASSNETAPLPETLNVAEAGAAANGGAAQHFVSPEVEKELENASADGDVAALTPEAVRTVWIEARKSFYRREYAQSEKRYRRVIAMTDDKYDAYGELGNVYFHQGKNDEAAEAYFQAATILIDDGQVDRARSLLGLMRFLDKDKAQALKQKIDAAQ